MKRTIHRLLSLMLAAIMLMGLLCVTAFAEDKSFSDVKKGAWYYESVESAAKLGLLDGFADGSFQPDGKLTVAQAVKLAACVNQVAADGKVSLVNGDEVWYSTYQKYAEDKGILLPGSDLGSGALISRGYFAELLAKAVPEEQLPVINVISDGKIPDVPASHAQAEYIYKLFRAGIVQGDDKGNFNPGNELKRSEAAAILVRINDLGARLGAADIAVPDHDETFVIVHTNDVHGYVAIEPYVKAVADSYKAFYGEKNVITVSAGDVFGGGEAFKEAMIVPVMDAAKYDLLVPGNNDIYGNLEADCKGFTYTTVLCSNLNRYNDAREDTGEAIFTVSKVYETAGGAKIGFFGVETPGGAVGDMYYTDPTIETAQAMTQELSKSCGVVIGIGHTGWNDDLVTPSSNDATSAQVADACQGLTAYIDAHSHSVIGGGAGWRSDVTGCYVNQTGSKGENIGVCFVYLKDGKAVAVSGKLISLADAKACLTPDAVTQAEVSKGNEALEAALGKVIGHTDYYLNADRYDASKDGRSVRCDETNLGDLVADAVKDFTGADIGMFPGYQLRASIPAGDITLRDFTAVFGKGGSAYLFEKTGEEILEVLKAIVGPIPNETPQFYHVSGVSFKYNKDGNEVTLENVLIGGQPVDPAKIYTIAYDGADPDFDKEANADKLKIDGADQLVQIMADYFAAGKANILPDVATPGQRIIPGTITGTVSMDPGAGGGGGGTPPPKP